ncbi:MAG: hypothetical protein H0W83_01930 [Planctomycetes bacterium]|nr:hypothetical protein [Planctomycetota bacterium]
MTDLHASPSAPPSDTAVASTGGASYEDLRASLARVRWALKRAAAARGLAVVVLESVGMLLVLALLDYLYVMPQIVRIGVLAVAGVAVGVLIVRHVVRELLRTIPDEQVAMYIEERQQGADGALLSATAFGQSAAGDRNAAYRYIVDHIVASAASQAGGLRLSRVLDLARLRKYVLTAAVVLFFCAVSAIKFSSSRVHRLLMPWQASKEDLASVASTAEERAKIEFQIALDPQDRRLSRGSSLGVKAKLSGSATDEVRFSYRLKGSAAFKTLPMQEVDELNTYTLRLPDIVDDLEFFLQCGGQVSETVAVSVFDPLELKGYQVTVVPPEYAGGQPSVVFGRTADISALVGSRVILRALANTALAGGEAVFGDGRRLPLVGETGGEHAAKVEFTIDKDATFSVAIASVDQQAIGPSSVFAVHAIVDEPPTVAVTSPTSDLSVHASAEIPFIVHAGDDVGLDHVDLVYNAGKGDIGEHRLAFPLTTTDRTPGEHDVALLMPLAEAKQHLKAGDSLFYHVQAFDRKGQQYTSDIYLLKIRPYEIAGAFPNGVAHEAHRHPANLMAFIAAVWNIHVQKARVSSADYDKLCDEMAEKMGPGGVPLKFAKPKPGSLTPEKAAMVKEGDDHIVVAIAKLKAHDAEASTAELRQALALYTSAGVGMDMLQQTDVQEIGGVGGHDDPMADALGFLKMDAPKPAFDAPPPGASPDYHRAIKGEDAKRLRDEAKQLEKKQEHLIAEVKKLAMVAADPHAAAPNQNHQPPAGEDQAKADQKPPAAADGKDPAHDQNDPQRDPQRDPAAQTADVAERTAELGKEQQQLAEDANRLAQQLAKAAPNADKDTREVLDHLRQTHEQMAEAADKIRAGTLQQAAAHGEEARHELAKAAEKLDVSQFADLQHTIEAAEDRVQQIAEQQKRIRDATDRVVEDAAKRNPDPNAEVKLTAPEAEKIRGLAKLQVENQKAAEDLEAYVQQVAKLAQSQDKKEAADELKKAAKTMEQDQLAETMVTAAVNLAQHDFTEAKETQKKLGEGLDKLTHQLQAANGAMAATREQKLKRADAEVKELIAKTAELGGVAPDGKPAEPIAADGKDADHHDGDAKTADAKTGDAKNSDAHRADPAHADAKNPDAKTGEAKAAEATAAKPKKELSDEEQRQAQADLRRATARLAKRIADDHLADATVQAQLQALAATDDASFRQLFATGKKEHKDQNDKLGTFISSLKSVSNHLEGKLESVLKAKRLSAATREETPAQYRVLVNRYYEQLAKE